MRRSVLIFAFLGAAATAARLTSPFPRCLLRAAALFLVILVLSGPARAANVFAGDPNCVALWRFEALTAEKNITSSASTGTAAWRAFDEGTIQWSTTVGSAVPSWLMLDWNTGREKLVTKYQVQASTTTAPNTWTFDGYNGSGYTVLDSQAAQAGWGVNETRTFTFSNTTAYQGYRISISANNGGTTTAITELNLFGLSTDNVELSRKMTGNTMVSGTVADAQGSHSLAAFANTTLPTIDAVDYKEGAACIDIERGNVQHLFIPDAKLASSFPMKVGTTNYSISVTFWMKWESTGLAWYTIWGKSCDTAAAQDQLAMWHILDDVYFTMTFGGVIRAINTTTLGTACVINKWYFVAGTYDYPTGIMRLYIWDDTASAVLWNSTLDCSADGAPDLSGNDWGVSGGGNGNDLTYDGRLDEYTVWNRALSLDDIEDIRDGTYVPPTPPAAGADRRLIHILQHDERRRRP